MKRKFTYFDQNTNKKQKILKELSEDTDKIKDEIIRVVFEDENIFEIVNKKIEPAILEFLKKDYYYDNKDIINYISKLVVTKENLDQLLNIKEFDVNQIPSDFYLDIDVLLMLSNKKKLKIEQVDEKFFRNQQFIGKILNNNFSFINKLPHYYKYNLNFLEKNPNCIFQILISHADSTHKKRLFFKALFYLYLKSTIIKYWNCMPFAIFCIINTQYDPDGMAFIKCMEMVNNKKFDKYIQEKEKKYKPYYDEYLNIYMIQTMFDIKIIY